MKLNEYIWTKLHETWPIDGIPTEEQIEKWIIKWYNKSFTEIGCDGPISNPRMPPSWLANWRKHIEDE